MSALKSRLGHSVVYVLSEHDAREIVRSRLDAGRGTARGNDPKEGSRYPAIIVADWYQPIPLPSTVGDIQWVVGAEHDGIPGPKTTEKIQAWQTAHGITPDGKWGIECEGALLLERRDAASVNLQVFLDGNDTWWATSRSLFLPGKHGVVTPEGQQAIDVGAEYLDVISNPLWWREDPKGHFYYA